MGKSNLIAMENLPYGTQVIVNRLTLLAIQIVDLWRSAKNIRFRFERRDPIPAYRS